MYPAPGGVFFDKVDEDFRNTLLRYNFRGQKSSLKFTPMLIGRYLALGQG